MVRFAPADPFDDETPAADPRGAGARRRAAAAVAPARRAPFRADQPAVGTSISVLGAAAETASRRRRRGLRGGFPRRRRPRFVGSNSSRRSAVRRRAAPAPGACAPPTACADLARLREDASALRDAEHLSPAPAGTRPPAPPGASIGCGACSPSRPIAARRARRCEPPPIFLDLPDAMSFEGLADALRDLVADAEHPLAAAAGASAAAMKLFRDAPPASTPRFSRCGCPTSPWRNDSAGTRRFRCWRRRSRMRRCVAARAASVRVPAIRIGRTPWPAPMRWPPGGFRSWRASCRVDRKRCWRPSPNCAPRAPGGSSNSCWTTTPCRRRAPRKPRGSPIAPPAACSIG